MIRKDAMTKLKKIEKDISKDDFHRSAKEVTHFVMFLLFYRRLLPLILYFHANPVVKQVDALTEKIVEKVVEKFKEKESELMA